MGIIQAAIKQQTTNADKSTGQKHEILTAIDLIHFIKSGTSCWAKVHLEM